MTLPEYAHETASDRTRRCERFAQTITREVTKGDHEKASELVCYVSLMRSGGALSDEHVTELAQLIAKLVRGPDNDIQGGLFE